MRINRLVIFIVFFLHLFGCDSNNLEQTCQNYYFENGTLKEKKCFANGELISDSIYREDGFLMMTVEKLEGTRERFTNYMDSNIVNCVGYNEDGKLNGIMTCYTPSGKVLSKYLYKNGEKIKRIDVKD